MVGLTLLNWLGLRSGSRAQELTSLIKAVALVALVVACFVTLPSAAAPTSVRPAIPGGSILVGLVVALQAVIITYDGWYSAIYFMEEDRDPASKQKYSGLSRSYCCGRVHRRKKHHSSVMPLTAFFLVPLLVLSVPLAGRIS